MSAQESWKPKATVNWESLSVAYSWAIRFWSGRFVMPECVRSTYWKTIDHNRVLYGRMKLDLGSFLIVFMNCLLQNGVKQKVHVQSSSAHLVRLNMLRRNLSVMVSRGKGIITVSGTSAGLLAVSSESEIEANQKGHIPENKLDMSKSISDWLSNLPFFGNLGRF